MGRHGVICSETRAIGATILYPFRGQHAVRGSFSTGAVTSSGGNFDVFAFNYLYVWR